MSGKTAGAGKTGELDAWRRRKHGKKGLDGEGGDGAEWGGRAAARACGEA